MSGELVISKQNWLELKDVINQVPTPFAQEIFLEEMEVSGTMDIDDIIVKCETLKENDLLALKRETANEFDEYAVQVATADGIKLGYVPTRWNTVFARLMDAGKLLVARFCEKGLIDDFYQTITIRIYLKEF